MTDGAARPWLGTLFIVASAVIFSTAGLFTNLIHADPWTMLFWRGFFGGLFIAAYIVWENGSGALARLRAMGWPDLAAGACSTVATICFIHAFRHTSVANVTIIFATAPFIAAAVAWLWLRERQSRATLAASLFALGGVLIMMVSGLATGHLLGDLLALAMTILIATMMVIIRQHRAVSMLPATCLSAFACAALVWPWAQPMAVTAAEFSWLAVFGSVQFGLGLLLLTMGSRLLPGPRAALFGNVELPLAPLWAWLALGQVPLPAVWMGGLVVTLALGFEMAASLRPARQIQARGDG